MKLKPETVEAHKRRAIGIGHNSKLRADVCPRCKGIHLTPQEAEHCRQANAQREQF